MIFLLHQTPIKKLSFFPYNNNLSKRRWGRNLPTRQTITKEQCSSNLRRTETSVVIFEGAKDARDGKKLTKSTQQNNNSQTHAGMTTSLIKPEDKGGSQESLKLLSWNARSLTSVGKIREILKYKADIAFIQEIWNPPEELLDLLGNNIEMKRRADNHGGTLLYYNEEKLPISRQSLKMNEDCHLSKHILHGNKILNLCSLYIPKASKKAIIEIFNNLQRQIPETEYPFLLIMGDWNVNIQDKSNQLTILLHELCKQMGLHIGFKGPTRGNNTIDFAIHGKGIVLREWQAFESLSDHKIVTCEAVVECPKPSTKRFLVPNRKTAERMTLYAINNAKTSQEYLELLTKGRKKVGSKIMKTIKIKSWQKNLQDRLLRIENEDEDIRRIIQEYWMNQAEQNEDERYSQQSKKAFEFLRRVYKYNQYEKRDGSIVNKIMLEDNRVVTNPEEVAQSIIESLKEIQTKRDEPEYTNEVPFPKLSPLDSEELEAILRKLGTNKAISYDGVSDVLFSTQYLPKVKSLLTNLWSCSEFSDTHFETRLVPLNKVHPKIPSSKQFRPIIIQSPNLKLLEARFQSKLMKYMKEGLHIGQTGFVPGMGISVNQIRAVQRIGERTCQRRKVFGLFIDFSNAYNTVLHTKLFERLKGILQNDEIQFQRAIYSRLKIRLESKQFKPNIGVAQGSVISPPLFNIYSEDLLYKIEDAQVSNEDLLAYADDLLVVCTSLHQLRQVIKIIRKWSKENNLELNDKKSGIVEFLPRSGRQTSTLKTGSVFESIPIVDKYKYLGLWLDKKLTLDPQLHHIKKKSGFIRSRLAPLLGGISLDYRINLWTVFIRPLFDQTLSILYAERNHTNPEKVRRLIRKTFKDFTLLPKNTEDKIIEKLSQYNIDHRAANTVEKNTIKWESRKKREEPNYQEMLSTRPQETENGPLPKELQEYISIQTALCPACLQLGKKAVVRPSHLLTHNLEAPSPLDLIEEMTGIKVKKKNGNLSRIKTLRARRNLILPHLSTLKDFLNTKTMRTN